MAIPRLSTQSPGRLDSRRLSRAPTEGEGKPEKSGMPRIPARRDTEDMALSPEMRASDNDRERAADILRDAHVEGRLDQEEFLQRLDATYTARTYGDLERLVADLPRPAPRRQPVGRPPATEPLARSPEPGRKSKDRGLRAAWTIWGLAVSVNLVVWLLVSIGNGRPDYFWPMWVAGPWGAVLLVLTLLRRSD